MPQLRHRVATIRAELMRHDGRGGELKGFAICGDDRKFVWAWAEIVGDAVAASSPDVAHPVAVRYGWADFPEVNLWNKDSLPASPFRTDSFPMITAPKSNARLRVCPNSLCHRLKCQVREAGSIH